MARARVYRHDVRCPDCGSNRMRRDGCSRNGHQTYQCGDCPRRHTPEGAYRRPGNPRTCFGDVCRVRQPERGGAAVSGERPGGERVGQKKGKYVLNQFREAQRRRTEGAPGRQPAAVIAWDEMWTYRGVRRRGKREDCWIWTEVVAEKNGSRWLDFEVEERSEAPFLRLYERMPEAARYCSDGYPVYGWLPANRHEVGKYGPVNWSEGLHSWLRGKLNRLVRRTKGYTKSVAMLVYSLALVCWYRWAKFNFSAS